MSNRVEFSKKTRVAAFDRCKGRCEKCEARLITGSIIYDHIIPWELSRDSSLENCQVVCKGCDKPKTKKDQGNIAKMRHVRARHIGAKVSRTPMPFGRKSKWKKKINGKVVPRWGKQETY